MTEPHQKLISDILGIYIVLIKSVSNLNVTNTVDFFPLLFLRKQGKILEN